MSWLEKYKDTLNIRYETFKTLFDISHDRKLTNIVETGTARGKVKYYYLKPKINWKDGMSTLLFAEYTNLVGGSFWSCDIDNKNIYNAHKFTKQVNENVIFVAADSHIFLKNITMRIDILYLDSLDGNMPGANKHQLKEAELSLKHLSQNGLILLDDKGSKTNMSIPFLIDNGWNIIKETDQQVLSSK